MTFERTKNVLNSTNIAIGIDDIDSAKSTIDDIVLVGGSTKMQQIEQMFLNRFGKIPFLCDPDEIVSKGAAIIAHSLTTVQSNNMNKLVDITSKSFGIKVYDKDEGYYYVQNIINRNSRVPVEYSYIFETLSNNQKKADIEIYENEAMAIESKVSLDECSFVGEFSFKLPLFLPKDSLIEIAMLLDENQILYVLTTELTHNKQKLKRINLKKTAKLYKKEK
jgi:molecular chaperone DnaK